MKTSFHDFINKVTERFKGEIADNPAYLLEFDIGAEAGKLGFEDIHEEYRNVTGFVPLKHAVPGMKVMFDGRGFGDYAQFDSGVVVPGYVARETGLPSHAFAPDVAMVRIFA
ncbi:MAG: hypothetical protein ACLFOY_08035 [Desulfatibacillaceae bacterium]